MKIFSFFKGFPINGIYCGCSQILCSYLHLFYTWWWNMFPQIPHEWDHGEHDVCRIRWWGPGCLSGLIKRINCRFHVEHSVIAGDSGGPMIWRHDADHPYTQIGERGKFNYLVEYVRLLVLNYDYEDIKITRKLFIKH